MIHYNWIVFRLLDHAFPVGYLKWTFPQQFSDKKSLTMPVGIAPSGKHKLAHPDGELATARGEKSVTQVNLVCICTCDLRILVMITNKIWTQAGQELHGRTYIVAFPFTPFTRFLLHLLLPGWLASFNSEDSSERINKKLQIKIRLKCYNKN